ncbi:hypothetical protein [Opitutus sp. ER46]|uniref:hypothetical protein n=1 Tax=Opitutus sp. ER46 TaxID=2161864 RepID=UPI000D31E11B|nr:hypothetical protein [Opitutus sp. ER46]PTX94450.1 hypothetical protein DB354_11940 [Opitutus sp. ER46]
MIRLIVNLAMLVIGIAGFCAGIYFRNVRRDVGECLAPQSPPAPSAAAGRDYSAELFARPATAAPATLPPPDLAHMPPVKEWNQAYTRLRFYGWLERSNLDPEKRTRVEAILQSHAATVRSLDMEFRGDGRHEHRRKLTGQLTDAMRPVLDGGELAGFQQNLALEEVDRVMNDLGAALYSQEAPLTPEQSRRLTAVICESRTPADRAAPVLELSATDWDAVLEKAALFLSSQQLEAVRALATQRQFMLRFEAISGFSYRRALPGL